jgi:RNA polymerase sigma-70 factor (ECF subfamily)
MVASQASNVLHCIRTLALHEADGATDGSLLDLYIQQKDEAAFAALVRRHGRMVLGVCRRILGNSHDADDAFQATFLVLVRKAASIRPAGMVGNWLYGVAQRTALEARKSAARRRAKEAQVPPRTEMHDDSLVDLRTFLDQELSRLPDKYRTVLVLCDLEERSRKEAAKELGLPEGTIASRQARARDILARRLTRHGLALSSGALTALLAEEAVAARTPLSLVFATAKAASAYAAGPAVAAAVVPQPVADLVEGVLRAMSPSKLKHIALLLLVIGVAGTGWTNYRTLATDPPAARPEEQLAQVNDKQGDKPAEGNRTPSSDDLRGKWIGEKDGIKVAQAGPAADDGKDALGKEIKNLVGTWKLVSSESEGNKVPENILKGEVVRWKITESTILMTVENKKKEEDKYTLDPAASPKTIDLTDKEGHRTPGIYLLDGDSLKVCLNEGGNERPKEFASKPGTHLSVWVFAREKR